MVFASKVNELNDSKLRKETAKGKYVSKIMSYNFIYELGMYLAKKQNFNLSSLYLFKYAFSELSALKNKATNRQNMIDHPDWDNFSKTGEF